MADGCENCGKGSDQCGCSTCDKCDTWMTNEETNLTGSSVGGVKGGVCPGCVKKSNDRAFRTGWSVVKADKIAIPLRQFWQGELLGLDIMALEDWLEANFDGFNPSLSLQENILAASGPETLAQLKEMLSRRMER